MGTNKSRNIDHILLSSSTFIITITIALFTGNSNQALLNRSGSCQILTDRIICSGSTITDASLMGLKDELHLKYNHMYFSSLHITDTEVTHITSGTFVDVQFEHIYIQDNKHLTYIAEDAFSKQNAQTLYIMNNPQLKNNSAYRLTDTLHLSEIAYFDYNGFVVSDVVGDVNATFL